MNTYSVLRLQKFKILAPLELPQLKTLFKMDNSAETSIHLSKYFVRLRDWTKFLVTYDGLKIELHRQYPHTGSNNLSAQHNPCPWF